MKEIICAACKRQMWIPDSLYDSAKASENISFYCAYGHSNHYPKGETDEDKLRRDRNRLAQQLAESEDRVRIERETRQATERQLSAQRGVVTRIRNRVGNGVCPCCNRTFHDLQRHMKSKHGDYARSAILTAAE